MNINVADIVESNGNTIRENNMSMEHTIPLGSLVEIIPDSDDGITDDPEMECYQTGGLRLFVVNHSRDCDGTPLYDMSFDKSAHRKANEYLNEFNAGLFENNMEQQLVHVLWIQTSAKILRHYSADSLKVIK